MTLMLLLFSAGQAVITTAADNRQPQCATCHKTLTGQFVRAGQQTFCSRECYLKSLPTCQVCGKKLTGKHLTLREAHFCSRECLNQVLPKCEICRQPLEEALIIDGHTFCREHGSGPRCSHCGLPFAEGVKLQDQRMICQDCNHNLVYRHDDAWALYLKARDEFNKVMQYRSPTLPELKLVGLDALSAMTEYKPHNGMVQRGVYHRATTTLTTRNWLGKITHTDKKIKETISILYALKPDEFLITAVHELTHDWLAEAWPEVAEHAPRWAEEGICQYVAAAVCLRLGYYKVLNRIEANPDQDYGDGYRYFQKRLGDNRRDKLEKWLRDTDVKVLPLSPPRL